MARTTLTETVTARVSRATKADLVVAMRRQQRSESAIVRLALIDYLNRKGR